MKIQKVTVSIVFAIGVTACQTNAQRQAKNIREQGQIAMQKALACVQKIESHPEFQILAVHTPLNGLKEPTLEQLTDSGYPTEEQKRLIVRVHNEVSTCREEALENFMQVIPGVIPEVVKSYHSSDLITADLITHKLTWGEANKKRLAVKDELRIKLQLASQQIDKQLADAHQAELAERQAAISAISRWAQQQQVIMQNQEIINSLHRPYMTNCTASGNYLNCYHY